jgi:hypothetical protein
VPRRPTCSWCSWRWPGSPSPPEAAPRQTAPRQTAPRQTARGPYPQ